MTMGNIIAQLRKENNMTQEALAKQLEVTNQAVSKWESDQCCPDIMLLPRLADLFDVSIDALFGRKKVQAKAQPKKILGLPWNDDEALRLVLYRGHSLLKGEDAAQELTFCHGGEEIAFRYEGEVLNIDSSASVRCQNVGGNVAASADVYCANVGGGIDAGGDVYCATVAGNVDAGGDVNCATVAGGVDAGGDVTCGDVGNHVDAGGDVTCGSVNGSIDAGGDVIIKK